MKEKKVAKNILFYGSCGLLGAILGLGEYYIATRGVTALYNKLFLDD